jgi:hypothetical protein
MVASAFAAGAAAALLVLYLMFRTAPGVIMADDMVRVLAVAAARPLAQFPRGSVVYVKSSVGPLLIETLRPRHPSLNLRPYSERPEDPCTEHGSPPSQCERNERNDFLKLELLSSPTRGTLLVAVGTATAFGQVLLISVFGQWRVLAERWYEI